MPTSVKVFFAAAAAWLAIVLLLRWAGQRFLARGPRGESLAGLMWLVFRAYCRLMHRTRYAGRHHVPPTNRPGGLVVVSNHTGPVDPLLIQSACRFEIRWMMARNMMIPQLEWLWRRYRIIPVARDGRDSGPAREAIRHVREGGVVGIFPEGGIVRPSGELRPFHNGVGLIIARTRAPVLLVWITGTPPETEMWNALCTPSRSRVEFVDLVTFPEESDPAAITEALRRRLAEVSGWPINDQPLIPPQPTADPFAA